MSSLLSVVIADLTKRQLEQRAAKTGLTVSELVRFGVAGVLSGQVDLRPDRAQQMLKGLNFECESLIRSTRSCLDEKVAHGHESRS